MTIRFASRRRAPTASPSMAAYVAFSAIAFSAGLALTGCARSVTPTVEVPPDLTLPADGSPLEACLLAGGELTLRHAVNNNDVSEHGDVVSFAVSGERLAVGSVDGTIKLWTLDGFVGSLASGALTYGPELARTEARDLAFLGEEIVSGDARGLVSAFEVDGGFRVLGGTDPETAIVAVAIAPAGAQGARLAHADAHAGGNVLIRELDADGVVGPLDTALDTVRDLQFASDGALLVAGARAADAGGTLERYDATGARIASVDEADAIRAIDSAGTLIAAVTDTTLGLYDDALVLRGRVRAEEHGPLGVALSAHGRIAFTVGVDETLVAWSSATGAMLASVAVPDAALVDTSPDADTVFVAARDGWLRAYGCRAAAP